MKKNDIITLVKAYTRKVEHAGIPVEKTIVFGSQIKGTSHEASDIDTCIVSPLLAKIAMMSGSTDGACN